MEWPTPKCVKEMQKFLGLVNYYCQFIKGFALIARPLHDLVKKDQKWNWMERQEKVFRELKEQFMKELVLAVLDLDKKMRMEVDTLDYATDRVLLMEYQDGLWYPISLSNQKLYITPKKGISTLDTSLLDSAVTLCGQVTRGHCSTSLLLNIYLTVHKRVI